MYGAEVIAELTRELHASVEMSAGFEGEMRSLVAYARSLALVLECIRECSGGAGAAGGRAPPIELLRRESLAGMPPQQVRWGAAELAGRMDCAPLETCGDLPPPCFP